MESGDLRFKYPISNFQFHSTGRSLDGDRSNHSLVAGHIVIDMPSERTSRSRRRLVTHLVTGGISVLLVGGLYAILPIVYPAVATDPRAVRQGVVPIFRISISTGYVSLLLLVFCMSIGTWHLLKDRRRGPVHVDLRRDVGIWAGALGLVHVAIGLFIHVPRDSVRNVIYNFVVPPRLESASFLRLGPFGIANHVGLLATILVILLLAISNDAATRKLGSRRWKFWQRSTCVVLGLLVIHSVLYQLVEHRPPVFVAAFVLVIVFAAAAQLVGTRFYTRYRG